MTRTVCRQGGMAPGRAVSPRWLRRRQHADGTGLDHPLLQSARHGTAIPSRACRHALPGDASKKANRQSTGRACPARECAQNEARLRLHALACNLGVFLQGTDLPEEIADWSLTSLQTRLIEIGARVVRHARAITFQLAEVAVRGDLFTRILSAIHRLRAPPGLA